MSIHSFSSPIGIPLPLFLICIAKSCTYKLNISGDNIHPWRNPVPTLNESVSNDGLSLTALETFLSN